MRAAWEWAEEKRTLPKGSAEAGPFRASRAPWVKTVTEWVSMPRYKTVVLVCGSQMSKTDGVLLNCIGHRMDDDPCPVLYIGPTEKNVYSIAGSAIRNKGRIGQMIRSVPSLWANMAKGKDETITEKWINGNRLGFGWAGSATELASHPAALGLLDEYDRMRPIPGEGDPFGLLDVRTSTYPDGCVVVTSTPLMGRLKTRTLSTGLTHWERVEAENLSSPTWALWQDSTAHEWAWPCPDCHEYFIPRGDLLWYPDDATPVEAARTARLTCPNCGSQIEDRQKTGMNARGVAVAPGQSVTRDGIVVGDLPESDSAGLWVSGLCSPWRSFGQRAAAIARAYRSEKQADIQVAINTGLGELYAPPKDEARYSLANLRDRAETWEERTIPDGVRFILAAVDVQKGRFPVQIIGYGENRERWVIDFYNLKTPHDDRRSAIDPAGFLEDWQEQLVPLLEKSYPLADGSGRMGVLMVGCDSGGAEGVTLKAYQFMRWLRRRHPDLAKKFMLVKGEGKPSAPIHRLTYPDTSKRKDRGASQGDVPVLMLGAQVLKDALAGDLARDMPGPGYIHIPAHLGDWWLHGLTREERDNRGRWQAKGKGNEPWDLLYYADGIADYRGLARIDWNRPPAWAAPGPKNSAVTRDDTAKPVQTQPRPARRSMVAGRVR